MGRYVFFTESAIVPLKGAEFRAEALRDAAACSVPCKMFQDELEDLCRREKLHCKDLGINRANINDYEVEFLCDYKKTKVSHQPPNTRLLSTAFALDWLYCFELPF